MGNFNPIEATSELGVELVDSMGSDLSIVNAARVSLNQHSETFSDRDAGLLNFLIQNRHSSPLEHCTASFLISAPIFVAREWMRHRTQSFNECSGRYTELKNKFYFPQYDRPLIQLGKPGAYRFEQPEDDVAYIDLYVDFRHTCQTAWDAYERLLERGIAKEIARMILPVSIYSGWYATANLRNWLAFLNLRTDKQAMYEIRALANQVEVILCELYPETMTAWRKNGRGQL